MIHKDIPLIIVDWKIVWLFEKHDSTSCMVAYDICYILIAMPNLAIVLMARGSLLLHYRGQCKLDSLEEYVLYGLEKHECIAYCLEKHECKTISSDK